MTAIGAFLFAFPALFSIINPIGGALIFNEATRSLGPFDKRWVAGRVGMYSLLVLLGAVPTCSISSASRSPPFASRAAPWWR